MMKAISIASALAALALLAATGCMAEDDPTPVSPHASAINTQSIHWYYYSDAAYTHKTGSEFYGCTGGHTVSGVKSQYVVELETGCGVHHSDPAETYCYIWNDYSDLYPIDCPDNGPWYQTSEP